MTPRDIPRLDRRTAIKWMVTAAAAAALPSARESAVAASGTADPRPSPSSGYGTDPDLLRDYKPGDLWPLTFTDEQRAIAASLCALIIPADANSPGAADLGVHDFIDEWISAPYADQAADRPIVIEGLAWIDAEARRRFDKGFAVLETAQQSAIADDICHEAEAKAEFKRAAVFFARFRVLTCGGFYSTPEGMEDIGYVGNRPSLTFDGPPAELIEKLGLA